MRSDTTIMFGITFLGSTQMHLAHDSDVIHTLTPDRPDRPFGEAILPRRGQCGGLLSDAHGAQSVVTTLP
jgi:hypothetical protein